MRKHTEHSRDCWHLLSMFWFWGTSFCLVLISRTHFCLGRCGLGEFLVFFYLPSTVPERSRLEEELFYSSVCISQWVTNCSLKIKRKTPFSSREHFVSLQPTWNNAHALISRSGALVNTVECHISDQKWQGHSKWHFYKLKGQKHTHALQLFNLF